MIRYADDFLVLCKNAERVREAEEEVRRSLRELKLMLHHDKTSQTSFDESFRFLGLYFQGGDIIDESRTKPATAPLWDNIFALPPQQIADERELLQKLTGTIPEKQQSEGLDTEGSMLAVTGEHCTLNSAEGHLRITRDGKIIVDRPWASLDSVVLIGPHHITTPALRAAMRQGIPVHFTALSGEYIGSTSSARFEQGRIGLWQLQISRLQRPEDGLRPACRLVESRIRHMREVLRRLPPEAQTCRKRLKRSAEKALNATSLQTLNGIEGEATREYYAGIRTVLPKGWGFDKRNRQPPRDPFNVMLSLGYSILYAHTEAILRADGLLPAVGVYHQRRAGHAALASDMMEPFRHRVESCATKMARNRQIKPNHFNYDGGRCNMESAALRLYLRSLHKTFISPTATPANPHPTTLHGHLHRQNQAFIRWLKEEGEFHAWLQR